jgi:hypothetical protein
MRRLGYGTQLLRLALPVLREHGIRRVRITCDDDNIGSAKIIEKNGGVLSGKETSRESGKTVRQYWIELNWAAYAATAAGYAAALAASWRLRPAALAPRPTSISKGNSTMAKYLISFPSAAMVVPEGEWEAVGRDAHAVIDEAKAAGVYVFGGGIDEGVPPVLVAADGAVAEGGYPWAPPLDGGFTVLELPSREEAVAWAARIAKACRCDQELRVFGFDPQS